MPQPLSTTLSPEVSERRALMQRLSEPPRGLEKHYARVSEALKLDRISTAEALTQLRAIESLRPDRPEMLRNASSVAPLDPSTLSEGALAAKLRSKVRSADTLLRSLDCVLKTIASIDEMFVRVVAQRNREWGGVHAGSMITCDVASQALDTIGFPKSRLTVDQTGKQTRLQVHPELSIPIQRSFNAQQSQEVRWFNEGRMLLAWNVVVQKMLIDQDEGVVLHDIAKCVRVAELHAPSVRAEITEHESDDYLVTIHSGSLSGGDVGFLVHL